MVIQKISTTLPGPSLAVMESLAVSMMYHRGQQIYRQKDPAEYWYRVVSGAARKCVLLADGRRQILDFISRHAIILPTPFIISTNAARD